ncbi:MAG: hypothetical protein RLZ12_527 [Bacillota bacterium]|jgi:uncharacterized membrane protein
MSRTQLKRSAKTLLSKNLGLALMLTVIFFLYDEVLKWLFSSINYGIQLPHCPYNFLSNTNFSYAYNFNSLATILNIIIAGPILLGIYNVFFTFTPNENPKFQSMSSFFADSSRFFTSFAWYIVSSVLILLWSLLFFIPGIVKAYSYALAPYLIVDDKQLGALEAIAKSKELMHGKKGSLFLLDLSFLGWYLLCLPTIGLALFWVWPYHKLSKILFYKDLLANKSTTLSLK